MKVAYHPEYIYPLPKGHRFPMEKYELLPQQLRYEGTLNDDDFFEPQVYSYEELRTVHTEKYLHALDTQTLTTKEERRIGLPVSPLLISRGKRIAMGTYENTQFAYKEKIALNIAGGTHHSFPGHGEGFCIFNDIALASQLMLDRKEAEKILIIDLDVHQGNGNAAIFEHNPHVFTFSMHGAKNYPHRKENSDLDIGLPDGTDGNSYLKILDQHLQPLINNESPDFIFYLSGVDVIEQDKLGRLSLTIEACKLRDRMVLEACAHADIPVAVSMGGGYAHHIKDIIEAHANTFREARDIFN